MKRSLPGQQDGGSISKSELGTICFAVCLSKLLGRPGWSIHSWRKEESGDRQALRMKQSSAERVFRRAAVGSHGKAGGSVVLRPALCWRESAPLLPLSLPPIVLGHSPGIPSGGAHTADCQLCSCDNICTEHADGIWRRGGTESSIEMKPIMGFLNICFIVTLNVRPPLTRRMEFYCVRVH